MTNVHPYAESCIGGIGLRVVRPMSHLAGTSDATIVDAAVASPAPSLRGNGDFSIPRAVSDHAPQRIAAIGEELEKLAARRQRLEEERTVLQKLLHVVEGTDND